MAERTRLPDTRNGVTQRFCLHTEPDDAIVCPGCGLRIEQPAREIHLYGTANRDAAGELREVFIGSQDRSGWVPSLEALAITLSVALQHGVPAPSILRHWRHMHGRPAGRVRVPWQTESYHATSLQDLLAAWLEWRFAR